MERRKEDARRNLVVLVGPDTEERACLARGLIGRGDAVVLCDGPPGCSMIRTDRCAIVETVDAVVVMPSPERSIREVSVGVTLCARGARCSLALEPSVVHVASGATRLRSFDPEVVGRTIDRLVAPLR